MVLDNVMSTKIYTIWAISGVDKDDIDGSITELDAHANMVVAGSQATVFHTGQNA